MVPVHVNTTLRELSSEKIVSLLQENSVKPELYIDGNEVERITREELYALREKLERRGLLPITIHAPFVDLSPGSPDETIRNISREKISKAIDIAGVIPARGVVVHSGYSDWHFDFRPEKWLENAVPTFHGFCEKAEELDLFIHVENIFERDPSTLKELASRVNSRRLRICFDAGHAHLFSHIPLVDWVRDLAPLIGEIHLHDNSGKRDEHLPLSEGTINYRGILAAIKERELDIIFALEPHTLEHARRTLSSFRSLYHQVFSPLLQDTL
ncbi:MAG: sugar phosphate isomerase/epimerase [Deltaproteobacteria bacterium]|nr:MAG: sugar phosphate isomerase/epimerase [Deltaproteobacteria bacterium]